MRPEKSILFALVCAFCLTGCGQSAPVETTARTEAAMPVMATEPVAETTAPTEMKPQEERFVLTFAGDCTLFQKIARLSEYTLMRMTCSASALARSPRYQFTAVVFP